ncbi:MAG: 1,4-dihydroxy-2-naphthoyl-CoA hydrolase [Chlamydiae bacterium]|nr:1,4-dihydroxy-2-naphthoyl-CoA hydrolase [Chlamydiota bacterium]
MFKYKRTIRVQDTDSTGALYFANQLQIGLEAFEEFLLQKDFSLGEMIARGEFLLPIVHAEADFLAPLIVGESIEATLAFQMGTTSFTHFSEILKGGEKVGSVSIVHVVYSPETKSSIPIPPELKNIFTI